MIRALLYCFLLVFALITHCQADTSSYNIEEKYIKVGDAELFCKVMGRGDPLIVLHGGAGFLTHDYLLPSMESLAKDNLVIFYDQRGLGKSIAPITPEQINLQTYVDDIEAIRLSLGIKKVSLLGHSWGSFLALHYAIDYPESVDKMILVSSMPVTTEDLGLFFPELHKRLAPYQNELQKIEASELYLAGDPKTVENQQRIVFQTYMYCPENIQKLNLWKSSQESLNGFKVWDIFKTDVFMKPYNLLQDLSSLKCPTLLIHGIADPIPVVTAEHTQAAIPSAQLIKIEHCGHFPFIEQPEMFFQAVDDFLH